MKKTFQELQDKFIKESAEKERRWGELIDQEIASAQTKALLFLVVSLALAFLLPLMVYSLRLALMASR